MGILQMTSEVSGQSAMIKNGESRPDPEVLEKPQRRKFTAAYKLKVLETVDGFKSPGELGAFLRREGLYHSYLTTWKRQRESGQLVGLSPKKRGRKIKPVNPLSDQVEKLEKENARLHRDLEKAIAIIDVQKKISALMGVPQSEADRKRSRL